MTDTTQNKITRKERRAKRGRPQEVRIVKLHHVIPHVEYVDGNWKELDDPKYVYLTVSSDGREHEMQLTVDKTQAQWLVRWLQEETEATDKKIDDYIDDFDVFDSMRALLDDGVDLDDRAAVERVLINPYRDNPLTSERFINWCIKAAKANKAAGGLRRFGGVLPGGEGIIPPE